MNSRYLPSVAATLALAVAGLIAPTFVTQGSPATASPMVSVSPSAPAYDPVAVTARTRAQSQPMTALARRIHIRSHSHNPTITIIPQVPAILTVDGEVLVRYVILKATQRSSTPPTAFNGPNSPQYGATESNYGTSGTGCGAAGTGYSTAGTGCGTTADVAQPGSLAYGTGTYSHQQGVQRPYGTGF